MVKIDRLRRLRPVGFGLGTLMLLCVSGCVEATTDGPDFSVRYKFWVPLAVFLGGVVAAPLGWYTRRISGRLGWGLMVAGVVAVFGFAPSLFMDRFTVGRDGLHVQTGIWGLTAVHNVKFDEISTVRIISETQRTRRGGSRTHYFFLCERKAGPAVKVPVNNDVAQAAAPVFLLQLTARKIPVVDETGAGEG